MNFFFDIRNTMIDHRNFFAVQLNLFFIFISTFNQMIMFADFPFKLFNSVLDSLRLDDNSCQCPYSRP